MSEREEKPFKEQEKERLRILLRELDSRGIEVFKDYNDILINYLKKKNQRRFGELKCHLKKNQ